MSTLPLFIQTPQRRPQKLRGYQEEAVSAVFRHWQKVPSTLGTAATGLGKTTVIAEVVRRKITNLHMQRALIIAHTNEIVDQIYERVTNQFAGDLDRPYTDARTGYIGDGIGRITGEHKDFHARVIVATRQSLHAKNIKKMLQAGSIDLFVIDEAHHAFIANTYGKILEQIRTDNPHMRVLGVTATPKRDDKKALGSMFNTIAFEYPLQYGIENQYLVPALRRKISTQIDTSSVATSQGDYAKSSLVSILEAANWIDLAEEAFVKYIPKGTLTLAFLPTVEMSKQFADKLNAVGIKAAHVDGTTPKEERRQTLLKYRRRQIEVVCNVAVFTEGFDAPETAAIFLARPTRSEALFTQIVGRGLRPHPNKKHCLLVDLSVSDTRAIDAGDLLGGTTKCDQCDTEYWKGMERCPACGYQEPKQEKPKDEDETPKQKMLDFDAYGDLGKGIVATLETLNNAWYTDANGYMSSALISDEKGKALLIVPPIKNNYYTLWMVNANKRTTFLADNEDLASLMIEADSIAIRESKKASRKDAHWRNKPASTAQKTLAAKLGIVTAGNETSGQIGQMISHKLTLKNFKPNQQVLI